MDFLAAAKKGAHLKSPKPKPIYWPKKVINKRKEDIEKKPREHQCRKCDETLLATDIEKHLNDKHPLSNGHFYIICPKCLYYLHTSNESSRDIVLQKHNGDHHFLKHSSDYMCNNIPQNKIQYQYNPVTDTIEFNDFNIGDLLKETYSFVEDSKIN